MRHPSARRAAATGLLLALAASAALAQSPPLRTSFLGRYDDPSSVYADVWGEGNVAYVGRYGQAMVDLIDVSNPASPFKLSTYSLPSPDNASSAQDVKAGDGLLFVASESGGNNGVHIVDVRDPSSPTLLTTIDPEPGSFEFIHNVFYDNGWLYLVNSSDTSVAIIDLRSYDPDAAPASIGSWTYSFTVPGALFIHDITVQNGRLFCSGWDNLTIYDVSNLGTQAPTLITSVPGMSNHAVWPTADGEYFVTSDEREGGALRLYQLVGNTVVPRDSYQASISDSYSIHNPVIDGDRVYSSWYQAGMLVHQIDRTNHTLELVASYDTSTEVPSGFAGCWGVYPYLGTDRLLLSDLENGLYTIDASAVQIAFVDPRPETAVVGAAETITVELTNLGNVVADTGSVTLMASVNGAPYAAIPMLPIGGDRYQADLPKMNCNSSTDWYVRVDDLSLGTWTRPADAPTSTYRVHASGPAPTTIFSDDFQGNQGWSVTNTSVITGGWVRANPGGTGAQPESGDPEEAGANCYVTGSGGGSVGTDDLDGGPTVLTSPVLDFSAGDGLIGYSRWFFNDDADGDTLTVSVSNNNGVSYATVETVIRQNGGGWVKRSFRLSDYVTPTAQVRVRFSVADEPNSSITEAAIDAFRAVRFDCASAALAQVRTGTGLNPDLFSSQNLPIIGMDWISQIDATGIPGASLVYLLGFNAPLDPGLMLNFGELLVDVTAEPLITMSLPPAGGGATSFVLPIPSNCLFQGLAVYNQGVIFAPGQVTLTNAVDIVLEY